MSKVKVALLAGIVTMSPLLVHAGYVPGVQKTTIKKISTYGRGNVTGDVTVITHDAASGCEQGYYVRNDNPGKDSILSIALSAYHTRAKVTVNAYSDPRWPGSGGNYCEIEGLILQE